METHDQISLNRPAGTNLRVLLPCLLITVAAVLAYLPSFSGAFIWNDADYVTAPELQSVEGLLRIWFEPGATEQYYPLLHGAFWVQHRLFGDNPLWYHILNLSLHIGSALLFGFVLRRLFEASGPDWNAAGSRRGISTDAAAWLAAFLFALHPVHVESVAWITEQKNTQSLLLCLAALWVYLDFDRHRSKRAYYIALALFGASLLSKTVTASLPAVMLVIVWWKRGRIDWSRDVKPLLPWFALSLVTGLFISWFEHSYIGAKGAAFELSAAGRLLVAGRAVWFYLGQVFWPAGLNFIYFKWEVNPSLWWQWLYPLFAVFLAVALWTLRKRSRGLLAAYLIFVGTLFPVLGFVNLYGALYSWVWDHWQYLSDLAPIALVSFALVEAGRRLAGLPLRLAQAGLAALVVFLGSMTWAHCGMFHDDVTLYQRTLERNPRCWMAHYNLGRIYLAESGLLDKAIHHFKESVKWHPDFADAHNNLGLALFRLPGRLPDAIREYREALRINPDYVEAHGNLGLALVLVPGSTDEAIAELRETLRWRPDSAAAHYNLAWAFSFDAAHSEEAIAQYRAALRLDTKFWVAHVGIGGVLLRRPETLEAAIAEFSEALRGDPGLVDAHFKLAEALSRKRGGQEQAIAEYRETLKRDPSHVMAHINLGVLLATCSRMDEALVELEAAVRVNPGKPEAHYNLGLALALQGRWEEAAGHFERTVQLSPGVAMAWHNLGLAWMKLGRQDKASAAYERERALAQGR